MTVRLSADGIIALEGKCPIEDAETLQQYLLAMPGAIVEWHACAHAHTAVIQVLMASGAKPRGVPVNEFLKFRIAPLLSGH